MTLRLDKMEKVSPELEKYYCTWEEKFKNYDGEYKEIVRRIPRFLKVLLQLLNDRENVKQEERLQINAAISYLLAPQDVIPEVKDNIETKNPFSVYVDDVFLCSKVLNDLSKDNSLGEDVIEKAWEEVRENIEGIDIIEEIIETYRKANTHIIRKWKKGTRESILDYAGLE